MEVRQVSSFLEPNGGGGGGDDGVCVDWKNSKERAKKNREEDVMIYK